VHKNLFCGTDISLIVKEDFLDVERPNSSAEALVSEIILTAEMMLKCQNCGRIILVKETKHSLDVRFFLPEKA
jgi:DNA-directed RNA polymerase subunit RPC12/RpoP